MWVQYTDTAGNTAKDGPFMDFRDAQWTFVRRSNEGCTAIQIVRQSPPAFGCWRPC
jgi:hypothetical protein